MKFVSEITNTVACLGKMKKTKQNKNCANGVRIKWCVHSIRSFTCQAKRIRRQQQSKEEYSKCEFQHVFDIDRGTEFLFSFFFGKGIISPGKFTVYKNFIALFSSIRLKNVCLFFFTPLPISTVH